MKIHWMIYGANGYSAQLAARKAVKQGLSPILAGRNATAVNRIAEELGLESRIFSLDNIDQVAQQLEDIRVVSHCAGPFSATAEAMMKACIQSGTHYTDITGEIPVFETGQSLHEHAKEAGAILCGGVGFDVIPTDCMAGRLKEELPDATHLSLGFSGGASLSPGTAKTMVEMMGKGTQVRRDGQLVVVPSNHGLRTIDFGSGPMEASLIPWGDVSTAYWQTGIPNIQVYIPAMGGKVARSFMPIIQTLLKSKTVQNFAKKRIEASVTGPDENERAASDTYVWGEVTNDRGDKVTGRICVPNGYTVTMDGIILSAQFLMKHNGPGGCYTPAQLMGSDLMEKLPGASSLHIERE